MRRGRGSRCSAAGSSRISIAHDVRQRFQNLGAQADVRFQLLTLQPLTLSCGYARAWRESDDLGDRWMVSLKIL